MHTSGRPNSSVAQTIAGPVDEVSKRSANGHRELEKNLPTSSRKGKKRLNDDASRRFPRSQNISCDHRRKRLD
jgi:hypothetical protein